MKDRTDLQALLEELLGSRNVYYQPPASVQMKYPAIRYNKEKIERKYANNKAYINKKRYSITVIDPRPDNSVIDELLERPLCSFDRHYTMNNLNHDVLTLYY